MSLYCPNAVHSDLMLSSVVLMLLKLIIHSSALKLSKLIQLDRTGKYALFDAQQEKTWSDIGSDNDELEQVPADDDICSKDVSGECSISVEQEECWD